MNIIFSRLPVALFFMSAAISFIFDNVEDAYFLVLTAILFVLMEIADDVRDGRRDL